MFVRTKTGHLRNPGPPSSSGRRPQPGSAGFAAPRADKAVTRGQFTSLTLPRRLLSSLSCPRPHPRPRDTFPSCLQDPPCVPPPLCGWPWAFLPISPSRARGGPGDPAASLLHALPPEAALSSGPLTLAPLLVLRPWACPVCCQLVFRATIQTRAHKRHSGGRVRWPLSAEINIAILDMLLVVNEHIKPGNRTACVRSI